MLDLSEDIRNFIDAGAPPVSVNEIWKRQPASQLSPTRTGPRRRRVRRAGVLAGLVAVAAAVLLVMGLNVTSTGVRTGETKVSAATVLLRAANVAASQPALVPGPGQFLYVRTLDGSKSRIVRPGAQFPRYYIQYVVQTWSTPNAPGASTVTAAGTPEFITAADRALWEADGSPTIEAPGGGGGPVVYYDVADLPTDPSRIAAYFASQPDLPNVVYGRTPEWEFTTAVSYLQNGASSDQRAALLRFMATIPGVENLGSVATFGTHRTGTLLSLPSDTPGISSQAIIDANTSEVLEERGLVTNEAELVKPTPAKVAAGLADAPLQEGQVVGYVDFLFDGLSETNDTAPADAPAIPPSWPPGTSVPPAAGSAYP